MMIDIAEEVVAIIAEVSSKKEEDINLDKSLLDLGLDSIELTDVFTKIEERFDINIDPDKANEMSNKKIITIIEYLKEYKN